MGAACTSAHPIRARMALRTRREPGLHDLARLGTESWNGK
jgi:hypothetical protein